MGHDGVTNAVQFVMRDSAARAIALLQAELQAERELRRVAEAERDAALARVKALETTEAGTSVAYAERCDVCGGITSIQTRVVRIVVCDDESCGRTREIGESDGAA